MYLGVSWAQRKWRKFSSRQHWDKREKQAQILICDKADLLDDARTAALGLKVVAAAVRSWGLHWPLREMWIAHWLIPPGQSFWVSRVAWIGKRRDEKKIEGRVRAEADGTKVGDSSVVGRSKQWVKSEMRCKDKKKCQRRKKIKKKRQETEREHDHSMTI
jgi:hypothetical protein